VEEAYPGIEIKFNSSEKAMAGITNKIQALFEPYIPHFRLLISEFSAFKYE
jgi:hypothetical protein